MGHWAVAQAQPRKARGPWAGPARFSGGSGHGRGLVLCPMALSYILWPCPMSHCPVPCLMVLSCVLWPCPMFYDPVLFPMTLSDVPCPVPQIHMKGFEIRPNGKPTTANRMASRGEPFGTVLGSTLHENTCPGRSGTRNATEYCLAA